MINEIFYLELEGSHSTQINALNYFNLEGRTLESNHFQILIPIFSKDEGIKKLRSWKRNAKKTGIDPLKILIDQESNTLYYQDLKIRLVKRIQNLTLKKAI